MNISCEIIKDLLPLYHDGVCSSDSKKMIDDHIKHCTGCKAELDAMDNTIIDTQSEQNLSEAEAVKKLSRRWKKGMLKSALKGVLFTLITVAVALLVIYCFVDIHIG